MNEVENREHAVFTHVEVMQGNFTQGYINIVLEHRGDYAPCSRDECTPRLQVRIDKAPGKMYILMRQE
jgi:hypothetical protein